MAGILAIDQATTTGWAHCEPGQTPTWGHKTMGKAVGDDDSEIIRNFDLFICFLIEVHRPRDLIFETPYIGIANSDDSGEKRPVSAITILRVGGWRALIIRACEQYGVHWTHQNTQAAVKLLTGLGKFPGATPAARRKAKKQATVAACVARGWDVTEDEADALALLLWAENWIYPREAKERQMTFKKLTGQLFA